MTAINKQKFLAELGKLLTFMYEEDRQRAMELYTRMFEEANDDSALIQQLVSPTRQAVVVARAYNSNLGKLSVRTTVAPEDRDENGIPDYVQAIEDVRAQAWDALGIADEEEAEDETEPESPEEKAPAAEEEAPAAPQEEPDEAAPESDEAELSDETPAAEAPDEEETPAAEEEESEAPEEEGEALPEEESETEEAEALPAAEEADEPAKEEAAAAEQGIEFFTLPEEKEAAQEAEELEKALAENGFNVSSGPLKKSRRKPRVFLLILYILLAIPLTLAAIAVLLVPAVLFLALSIAAIICGVVLVSAAFKGFAVFADIMVLLGLSLVLFAFGLLFLWTSIWFIGGAIVGLVHGVAALCDKWCYKEVPVE